MPEIRNFRWWKSFIFGENSIMLIANPIYDVVFKYLMEDTEIARGLLSKIIGEEIIEISVQPQEYTGRSDKFEVIILRLVVCQA